MRFHREGYKTCDQCGKQFKESGQLNNHKKAKHNSAYMHVPSVICKLFHTHGTKNMSSMDTGIKRRCFVISVIRLSNYQLK